MKKIGEKILAVMADVGYVKKDGRNAFHKYNYASEEAVVTKIREALIKNDMVIIPSYENVEHLLTEDRKGATKIITTVKAVYQILDVTSGEILVVNAAGTGEDAGDKGLYKAMTGCNKYMLMKLFQIPTGDDPEREANNDSPVAPRTGDPGQTSGKNEKPRNAKERAFFAATNKVLDSFDGPVETLNEIFNRVLGANGVADKAEITDSKLRHVFLNDLKLAIGVQ